MASLQQFSAIHIDDYRSYVKVKTTTAVYGVNKA
jgi:hypothetical protein